MHAGKRALLAALIVAATSGPAIADDVEAARRHYQQGSKDFDLGLYDKAIEHYMAAYDAKPDPALLYNIAQAHKLAGHPVEAVRFYKTYLSRVPDASNADEVRSKIAELEKAIEQQRRAQAMPPDQVKPLGSEPSPKVAPAEPAPPPPSPSPSSGSDARSARTEKIAGIAVAAVGVVALGAGIGLAVKAKQDSDQLTALDRQQGVYDPSKDSSGRTLGVAGPTLIAVGAAAVVVGGVVFIVGQRASKRASSSIEAAR